MSKVNILYKNHKQLVKELYGQKRKDITHNDIVEIINKEFNNTIFFANEDWLGRKIITYDRNHQDLPINLDNFELILAYSYINENQHFPPQIKYEIQARLLNIDIKNINAKLINNMRQEFEQRQNKPDNNLYHDINQKIHPIVTEKDKSDINIDNNIDKTLLAKYLNNKTKSEIVEFLNNLYGFGVFTEAEDNKITQNYSFKINDSPLFFNKLLAAAIIVENDKTINNEHKLYEASMVLDDIKNMDNKNLYDYVKRKEYKLEIKNIKQEPVFSKPYKKGLEIYFNKNFYTNDINQILNDIYGANSFVGIKGNGIKKGSITPQKQFSIAGEILPFNKLLAAAIIVDNDKKLNNNQEPFAVFKVLSDIQNMDNKTLYEYINSKLYKISKLNKNVKITDIDYHDIVKKYYYSEEETVDFAELCSKSIPFLNKIYGDNFLQKNKNQVTQQSTIEIDNISLSFEKLLAAAIIVENDKNIADHQKAILVFRVLNNLKNMNDKDLYYQIDNIHHGKEATSFSSSHYEKNLKIYDGKDYNTNYITEMLNRTYGEGSFISKKGNWVTKSQIIQKKKFSMLGEKEISFDRLLVAAIIFNDAPANDIKSVFKLLQEMNGINDKDLYTYLSSNIYGIKKAKADIKINKADYHNVVKKYFRNQRAEETEQDILKKAIKVLDNAYGENAFTLDQDNQITQSIKFTKGQDDLSFEKLLATAVIVGNDKNLLGHKDKITQTIFKDLNSISSVADKNIYNYVNRKLYKLDVQYKITPTSVTVGENLQQYITEDIEADKGCLVNMLNKIYGDDFFEKKENNLYQKKDLIIAGEIIPFERLVAVIGNALRDNRLPSPEDRVGEITRILGESKGLTIEKMCDNSNQKLEWSNCQREIDEIEALRNELIDLNVPQY